MFIQSSRCPGRARIAAGFPPPGLICAGAFGVGRAAPFEFPAGRGATCGLAGADLIGAGRAACTRCPIIPRDPPSPPANEDGAHSTSRNKTATHAHSDTMLRPGAELPRVLSLLPEIMVLLPQWQYRKPHHKTDSGWLFAAFSIASPIFFRYPLPATGCFKFLRRCRSCPADPSSSAVGTPAHFHPETADP